MFGLFKRNKILDWEKNLLIKVLRKIGNTNALSLLNQIEDDLLKGVLTNVSDIEGYVAFTYNSSIIDKYDNSDYLNYILTDIKVLDKKSNKYLNFSIYVSIGTISGYSIEGAKKFDLEIDNIDISSLKKKVLNQPSIVQALFSDLSLDIISKLDLKESFLIEIEEGDFWVIKDLEDGNYLAIDQNEKIYGLIHSPYEVEKIYDSKVDFINDLSSGKFNINEYYKSKVD